jgi:hypothetical protein
MAPQALRSIDPFACATAEQDDESGSQAVTASNHFAAYLQPGTAKEPMRVVDDVAPLLR